MLFQVKNKQPGMNTISVVNLSEKDLYIGRTKLAPGVSTPVESKDMLRKTSYVDRLWRNGVISFGATTDLIPKEESSVVSSEEEVTPPAANTDTSVGGTIENDTSPVDATEVVAEDEVKVEEPTVTPNEEVEIEETPVKEETPVVETPEEEVKTEEAPKEATPVTRPEGRKS